MKNKILWTTAILPLFISVIAIQFMEDKVPLHYDLKGNINRWGSKYEELIFPFIIIVFTLFWQLVINYFKKRKTKAETDKEKQEAKNNELVLYYAAIGTNILFLIMNIFIVCSALVEAKEQRTSAAFDINIVVNAAMGIFMIIIGNMLPKSKPNHWIGVRTVWSQENDKTWVASNRAGGLALMIAGVIITIQAILLKGFVSTIVMLAILTVTSIFLVWYSYIAYKKYK